MSDLFGMVGQSKISEDGMHFERRGESAQDSKTMSAERRSAVLVEERILSREQVQGGGAWVVTRGRA